jgi:hypothetical protein
MTSAGWLFMLVSLTFVWTLAGWCYQRLLRQPASQVRDEPEDQG